MNWQVNDDGRVWRYCDCDGIGHTRERVAPSTGDGRVDICFRVDQCYTLPNGECIADPCPLHSPRSSPN